MLNIINIKKYEFSWEKMHKYKWADINIMAPLEKSFMDTQLSWPSHTDPPTWPNSPPSKFIWGPFNFSNSLFKHSVDISGIYWRLLSKNSIWNHIRYDLSQWVMKLYFGYRSGFLASSIYKFELYHRWFIGGRGDTKFGLVSWN